MTNFNFRRALASVVLSTFLAGLVPAQDRTTLFDESVMRQRVIRLSSDEFEGRGPGTEGGRKAARYIADQLRAGGVRPGNRNSYFQNVRLVGVKANPSTTLRTSVRNRELSFRFGDDFVATTGAQTSSVEVDSELVFAGYGIDAPLYNWNDYKGDPDQYRGKVLMILVNDPPATTSERDLFGGKALTYYGRWTYKYEEAARRGAAGVILVHTNESAGYGWNVVRSSNGSWRYEIARTSQDKSPFLKLKSWATYGAADRLLGSAGLKLDQLMQRARSRDFRPVLTGIRVRLDLQSELKTFNSPNVVGVIPGSDRLKRNEYIVFTGHWDHLGVGEPDANGDRIYNGAYDNASGVAALLGIADAITKMPVRERPERSILFLFPTAEEQGLLGAEYYSLHPLLPLSRTIANINIDGVNFFGKTTDFMPLGADRSTLIDTINEAARERRMVVESDARPEQGFFFRSDHFPFARVGVPAVSLQHGDNFITPLRGEAASFFKDYTAKYYHQPSDQYKEWWDTAAMVQESELALAIAMKLASANTTPKYKDTDEFAAAERKRFRR